MSLLGLAIIGKKNEPLYLCDCASIPNAASDAAETSSTTTIHADKDDTTKDTTLKNPSDPFGFIQDRGMRESLGFEQRLVFHSAIDQLQQEFIQTSSVGLPVPRGRAGSWLGVVSENAHQDASVYGYVTATNVKFLLLVRQQQFDTANHNNSETTVRNMCQQLHHDYVAYAMNPMRKLNGPIRSKGFDEHVVRAVQAYRDASTKLHI
jgi:hypothetical protein